MITKLTKDQKQKIPEYLNKWRSLAYRTESINRDKAKEAIQFYYKTILKIDEPKYVIFLDSPMACELAFNLIKNTKFNKKVYNSQLNSQLESQLESQFDSQLYSQLYSQLRSQLYVQLSSQLGSQLYVQLSSQLGSQLESQLSSQLNSYLESQLSSQLNSYLESQLESQFDSQLGLQLGSQLYSQLDSQLGLQLGSQLESQFDSQLRSQLESKKMDFVYDSYPINLWHYGNYYGFYDYILSELMPEKKNDFKLFDKFLIHFKDLHYSWLFKDMAFLSDFPKEIHVDSEYRLHKDGSAALLYRDSYSLHSLGGVRMPDWVCLTKKEALDAEKVMAIENVEQRLMAIKKIGIDRVLHKLKSKVISEGALDDSGLIYRLHRVKILDSQEKLFELPNPSENKTHFEFVVPECETIFEADLWRRGYDDFKERKYEPTNLRA